MPVFRRTPIARRLAYRISLCLVGLAVSGLFGPGLAWAQHRPVDFTTGARPPQNGPHDWTLGPLGCRGFIPVQNVSTKNARQIYITRVDNGSPAARVLTRGDVLLGVNGEHFERDARITLAKAITAAEADRDEPHLSLIRWRDGETQEVQINLLPLGEFSDTAPYDCTKSDRILLATADALAQQGLRRVSIPNHINALALLATGDRDYLQLVRDYAHRVANQNINTDQGLHSWNYAFSNLFLTEYFLATRDRQVAQAIQSMTLEIARGQSVVGNWGHKFVRQDIGRLGGYGSINSVSLPLAISLVLARECGVDHPAVDQAIERSADFFRRHVDLGAIPYGDTPANLQYGHDDNGKNSAAAIFYDLIGDEYAADYYRRTALASFGSDREQGHTGNFFNIFWSMLGVSRCGPQATGAWIDEFGWYHDLARDWQFNFPYQGNPDHDRNKQYNRWDCPGAYLLHFTLPKRAIRLTGRGRATNRPLREADIEQTMQAGRYRYDDMTEAELVAALRSWSPIARYEASQALAKKRWSLTDDLARRLANDRDRQTQLTGLAAVSAAARGADRSDPRFTAIMMQLDAESTDVRLAAAQALIALDRNRAALVLAPVMAAYRPGDEPVMTQTIAHALFPARQRDASPFSQVEDRALVIAAIRQMLKHEDAGVVKLVGINLQRLPTAELRHLMPDIIDAGSHEPRANVMFMVQAQIQCLSIASRFRIEEAMEPLAQISTQDRWGTRACRPHGPWRSWLATAARRGNTCPSSKGHWIKCPIRPARTPCGRHINRPSKPSETTETPDRSSRSKTSSTGEIQTKTTHRHGVIASVCAGQ